MSEKRILCEICGKDKMVGMKIEPSYSNGFTGAILYSANHTRPVCMGHSAQERLVSELEESVKEQGA